MSRTRGSARASDSAILDTGTTGTGKIRMLRKQLEDARIKEQEEMDRIKDLELLVKDLQKEVESRDKTIAVMKEDQYSIASFQASPPESPFVMSPQGGSPSNLSPRSRSPPLGRSFDSHMSFEAYASKSFTEKDEKILELQEKNIELERKVMDLEESVKTKEELIRARTEAVTLMSADFSARGKETLDQLEDTRSEMKQMQANFAEQESRWREEKSILQVDLEAKVQKLTHMEHQVESNDRIRLELSAKNAELQEKVVGLQTALAVIKKEKREVDEQLEEDREEWKNEREELLKELNVAKVNREARDENLLSELKELCLDSEFTDKLIELQNKLTELEEEKGNLQLKIVDLEEVPKGEKQS